MNTIEKAIADLSALQSAINDVRKQAQHIAIPNDAHLEVSEQYLKVIIGLRHSESSTRHLYDLTRFWFLNLQPGQELPLEHIGIPDTCISPPVSTFPPPAPASNGTPPSISPSCNADTPLSVSSSTPPVAGTSTPSPSATQL